ncbi:hypothetical protein [Streptomyces sp. NPDC059943]|uniref:hypothetical protein n=1 Tax=Streptomyces sp. NPDC059943 TaxID=3347010 RepID=UPI0036491238
MDVERERDARWNPQMVWVEPDPIARLAALRRDNLQQVVSQVLSKGRAPRVCRYALSVGGQWPSTSLGAATAFAVRNAWQVGGEGQTFTDHRGASSPNLRTGWRLVRKLVRSGYADGVVVTTTSVISPHADEYEQELNWFALHCAFVAVVAPASQVGRL